MKSKALNHKKSLNTSMSLLDLKRIKKEHLNSLDAIFENRQGKDFLVYHTKKIDEIIKTIVNFCLRDFFGDFLPMQNSFPLTIVAMGSYAREELCIYSDIDLMLVYKNVRGYNIEPIMESILHLAWDLGFKVGHRVHEVSELFEVSTCDMTIKTAMIESRYLCGSKYLWTQIQNELNKIRNHDVKDFLRKKIELFEKRKEQYPLTMQPNVKECAGGLRDAHTLFWIANVLFGVSKLADLTPKVISEDEFRELRSAMEFIFRLRTALHLQAEKKQDVLTLESIPCVAKKLGFVDKPLQSAQVALARKTLKSLWSIDTISQFYIRKITAPFLFKKRNLFVLRESYVQNGFYLLNGVLYCSTRKKPDSLLVIIKMFTKFEDRKIEFDISVIYYIKKAKVPRQTPHSLYEAFFKLFHKKYLNQYLYAFYKAGVLSYIVKSMRHTINLPQFDGYHTYPVDIHSLKCVWHLENIEDSFIQELFFTCEEEEQALLRLVTFFHDIGKGKRGDHSKAGAKIFRAFARKIGLKEEMIVLGDRLIRHHTLMSNVASRKDIYSEKVIFSFIATMKEPRTLQLLYILTYCDTKSVGKEIYSSFLSKLLRELYNISLSAFSRDNLLDEATRRRRRERALWNNKLFLELSDKEQKKVMQISSNLFFIKYTSNEIVKIVSWAFSTRKISCEIKTNGNLELTILCHGDIVLSYLLRKLSYLNVVQMEIFELFDNCKYFKIEFSKNIDNTEKFFVQKLIEQSQKEHLLKPKQKPVIYEAEVQVDCEHSQTYATITLNAEDQKGLLAYVIYSFEKYNLKISTAKIQTIKNRTRNLFLIEKKGILCKNTEEILNSFIVKKEKVGQ